MTKKIMLGLAISTAIYTLTVSSTENTKPDEAVAGAAKSVAWYVANMQEAHAKNKQCYTDPNAKELQASPDCVNSLQALQLSFAGGNQPVAKR
jgi:hypothetical protein